MKRKKLPAILIALLCLLATALIATACNVTQDPAEEKIKSVDFDLTINKEYVRNEKIDLSGLNIRVTYENDNVAVIANGNATISGGDTSVAGKNKELTISYGGFEKTYVYDVRNTQLTLHLGEYAWNEQATVVTETTENYTDISEYDPSPDNGTDEFAGWFTDEECTKPAETNFDGRIDTSVDREIYAGYDVDYSTQFSYEENGDEITLTRLIGLDVFDFGALTIPETIKLRPVTKIAANFIDPDYASWYFYSSIDFGENSRVKEIGENAFAYLSNIQTVRFPSTLVLIGDHAFEACPSLTTFSFPVSLERIGSYAFYADAKLSSIEFAKNGALRFIGDYAFASCTSLLSVSLPDDISSVGMYSFSGCENLTDIYFGKSIRQIGLHAFRECPALERIDVSEQSEYYKSVDSNLYSKDGKTFIRYCFGKQEESFSLPEGVTSLYESAFDSRMINSALKKIELPESLTYIGDYAFCSFDGEFTLPASLKTISSYALSESLTESFSIDENNPYFTVCDGSIYSKDMTKLIAVPSRYPNEEFVLDSHVETICTGALNYNETIRFFVVPQDSNLANIEESGFVPFRMKNLCGIYLNKNQPFTLADNAMYSANMAAANKNFYVFLSESDLEPYRETWKNYRVFDESGTPSVSAEELIGYLRTSDETDEAIIASMKQLVSADFETTEEFSDLLQAFLGTIFGQNVQTSFTPMFDAIDSLRYGNAITPRTQSFIETFESVVIPYLTDYYYNLDDGVFGVILSFENVNNHYLNLPADIRTKIPASEEKMTAIMQRLADVTVIQKKILQDATDIMTGVTSPDIGKIREILADYNRYNTGLVSQKWSDSLHIFGLICSDQIAQFLDMEITAYNFTEVRNLCDRYFYGVTGEENVGINLFLSLYLKTESMRQHLYRYNDYLKAYKEFSEKIPAFIEEANGNILSYDLSLPFDQAACETTIVSFDNLDFNEQSQDAISKRNAMALRLCISILNSIDINEDTYLSASTYYQNSLAFLDDAWENCGATTEELAKYESQKEALLSLFGKDNNLFVSYLKTPQNLLSSDVTDEDIDDLWFGAIADPLYRYYNYSVHNGDTTMEISLEYGYYSVKRCLLVKKIVSDFSSVTAENYDLVTASLFGSFEYPGSFGISYYENIENADVATLYDELLLTDAEKEKYNELINQYRNLSK